MIKSTFKDPNKEDWIKEAAEGDFNGYTEEDQSPRDEKFVAWSKSCGWR